ncbi:MAG: AraC family transcriptional regulator [Polyangiaceae bacterium]
MDPTVPNHFVPALVSLALRYHLRPEQLFRRAGIDLDAARAHGAGFSLREVERLVEAFMTESKIPEIALLLGEHIDAESVGLFGQLISTSPTAREALAVFATFKRLLHPSFDLRVEEEDGLAVVRYASNDELPIGDKPYYAEAILASVVSLGRQFLGESYTPRRATFRHPSPSYANVYERIFACPIVFDQPYDALFFAKGLLDRPMLGKSDAYHRTLRAQAEGDLGASSGLPIAQVKRVLHARIADPDLDVGDVARVLGVSTRTLQRRLGEEKQSFRDLRDEVRFQRAKEALKLGDANIDEIAVSLGYRDRSNFVRAFTRWSGKSPSRFRAAKRAAPAAPARAKSKRGARPAPTRKRKVGAK